MAITDANGLVTTTLTSGTRTTSVQVIAQVDAEPRRHARSLRPVDAGEDRRRAAGADALQRRAREAQHRRPRPLRPRGRGVGLRQRSLRQRRAAGHRRCRFLTNGASIVDPLPTGTNGVATATLLTEGEIPPTGIVTIVGFTRGEEGFLDNNGNGVFDAGDTITTDNVVEPFADFRPLPPLDAGCLGCRRRARTATSPSTLGRSFEFFIDTGSLNGVWDTQGDERRLGQRHPGLRSGDA